MVIDTRIRLSIILLCVHMHRFVSKTAAVLHMLYDNSVCVNPHFDLKFCVMNSAMVTEQNENK